MKKYLLILLPLLTIFLNCENFLGGQGGSGSSDAPYMSMQVGDVRQIISVHDSSTLLWTVRGRAVRADGEPVFAMEWKSGTSPGTLDYYRIAGGYFMSTELDTTDENYIDIRINPFHEQRLAKLYPTDGEVFVHTPGDADSSFWTAYHAEHVHTFCGNFADVFMFSLDGGFLKTWYARGVGYIGTSSSFSDDLDFAVSYVKVGNVVIGSLWPEKDPTGWPGFPPEKLLPSLFLTKTVNVNYNHLGEMMKIAAMR